MIKRSVAAVLTVLYLITTVGFALNLHYCFNRVTSLNFNTPAKGCSMEVTGATGCCKYKHIVVKINDAHQGKILSSAPVAPEFKLSPLRFDFSFEDAQALAAANFRVDSPPPPCNITPYLKNCVFRI